MAGAESLPWGSGITADVLASVVRPLVREVHIESLSGDADLWGRPVSDERYAIIAHTWTKGTLIQWTRWR